MNMVSSVMMNKTKLGLLASAGVAALALGGCIAGPANAPCTDTASNSSSSSSSSSGSAANDVTKVPVPPGVVPTGAMIWDGSKLEVSNIDPPGSWFMMNDHSPKGEMEPGTNGDFQSAVANGM